MANILETMSRGFLSGAAGPMFEPIAGVARQGTNLVEQYARRVAEEKAKQAANAPQPLSEEQIRQQIAALGQAPEVPSDGGDYQYKATADPGSVGVAAIGIALQNWQKAKASKAEQLRAEYNKKLAKEEQKLDMIVFDQIKHDLPSAVEERNRQKVLDDRATYEFGQKQLAAPYILQRLQREAAGKTSGGSGGSGGGKVLAGDRPSGLANLTKDEAKTFSSVITSAAKDADGDPALTKSNLDKLRKVNPAVDALLTKAGYSTSAEAPAMTIDSALEQARVSKAQKDLIAAGQPNSGTASNAPGIVDVAKEIVTNIPNGPSGIVNGITTNVITNMIPQLMEQRQMDERRKAKLAELGLPPDTSMPDLVEYLRLRGR